MTDHPSTNENQCSDAFQLVSGVGFNYGRSMATAIQLYGHHRSAGCSLQVCTLEQLHSLAEFILMIFVFHLFAKPLPEKLLCLKSTASTGLGGWDAKLLSEQGKM